MFRRVAGQDRAVSSYVQASASVQVRASTRGTASRAFWYRGSRACSRILQNLHKEPALTDFGQPCYNTLPIELQEQISRNLGHYSENYLVCFFTGP